MSGSTNFPTSVDTITELTDGIDVIQADDVNNAYSPINAIQTFIGASGAAQAHNTDFLTFLANSNPPILKKASNSTLTLTAGTIVIKNSGQSIKKLRRNTADLTLTASDLDTGSFAAGYYYVYAVADTAASTFTAKISASSSAPTGPTNYELVGWFYNAGTAAIDITTNEVGNVKSRRDVPNIVQVAGTTDITTTSTSYVTMTDMTIRFYTSGRPVRIRFSGPVVHASQGSHTFVNIDIAGTDKANSKFTAGANDGAGAGDLEYIETLAAGTYTILAEWKVNTGTGKQNGSSDGARRLIVEEL